jgi:hypothetical protein
VSVVVIVPIVSNIGAVLFRIMQHVSSQDTSDAVLAALVGDDCSWCEAGTLAREEFKGDAAVVCEECGTPGARVW